MVDTHSARADGLPSYAVFAGVLAAAGLPIYIHAPKFYADTFGVSLTALGGALFALRLLDVVQDPLLGRLAARVGPWRGVGAAVALAFMALAMFGLFAITPPGAPLLWFAIMLAVLFSAYSFLNILFYARGVAKAATVGSEGHLRVARWRETGALLGVCLAAIVPSLTALISGHPFSVFAALFAVAALCAGLAMRLEWSTVAATVTGGFRTVLGDPLSRRLLLIALVNATPVAVSSTLFLFFVESRLAAPGAEGPLLLLFFLAAAGAAPFWSRAAERFGARRVLMAGMLLSVLAFGLVPLLGPGDIALFALICIASGAALGADMTLLPAMFARRLAQIAPDGNEAFGLWSFATKFTLAFAAVTLLPVLDAAGFVPGTENTTDALRWLTFLYAGVPCVLKIAAIGMLSTLTRENT